ncbi:MAG TPA: hypothetical protein VML95_00845 [Longimicrobiales bacterium]|nr:hypothetical protein [Longimicrobiales bacterium]
MIKRIGWMLAIALLVGQPLAADDPGDPEKAARYRAQAMDYLDRPDRWYDAAVLLKRAAEELDPATEEASRTMLFAGRVFAQAKSYPKAQSALEAAGELALARGDLSHAARAFVEAAHVASVRGRSSEVGELAERVRLITASPLLSAAEKSRLQGLVEAA